MRVFLLSAFLCLLCNCLYSQDISFSTELIDLGKLIKSGKSENFIYEIKNTGKEPLILYTVQVSCTCTKVDYPKKPIMPGESAELKVKYDPEKTLGTFHKAVQIFANTQSNRHIVAFKGEIIE